MVILDACRDNPFRSMAGGTRGLSRGLMIVEHPPQDLFIMFSTAPGTVAADGERDKRNSPFTEAFLKYMESPATVDTLYPLAQRFCPVKFFCLPTNLRAIAIALFPLMYPTTWATEYFGGISISICTWSGYKCPCIISGTSEQPLK
ncbi:hypothetical protein AGMMS50268_16710 [Spirochaetia bacterium]|nr:hypothetical protein AGMMS50268_16710 [Spirochaetia bacterium]